MELFVLTIVLVLLWVIVVLANTIRVNTAQTRDRVQELVELTNERQLLTKRLMKEADDRRRRRRQERLEATVAWKG